MNDRERARIEYVNLPHYEFDRVHADFEIVSCTERSNPQAAFRAQQIQGESYVASGFVHESGLDEYGRLQPELDRSRGDNVAYYLATSKRDSHVQAAVRVVGVPEGGTLHDIAAYRHSVNVMRPEYREFIEQYEQRMDGKVQEVAALSNTGGPASVGSFELIREVFQRAIRDDSPNLWIITFAPVAYKSIRNRFGDRVVECISAESIEVDKGDNRTSSELRLTPVVVQTDKVLDNLLLSIEEAPSARHAVPFAATLHFMADGLGEDELPSRVREFFAAERLHQKKGA